MQRYIGLLAAVPVLVGLAQASPVNSPAVRDAPPSDGDVSVVWVTETQTVSSCAAPVTSTIYEETTICPVTETATAASGYPTSPGAWSSPGVWTSPGAGSSHVASSKPASSAKASSAHASSHEASASHPASTHKTSASHPASTHKTTAHPATTHKTSASAPAATTVQGFDISNFQPNVNFAEAYKAGARFVIIKATEGTDYIDTTYSSHKSGAAAAGFIQGAYHFAHPNEGTGAAQADYFIAHGGGWSSGGKTLPGMLDLEASSSGECWGLGTSEMVTWIKSFSDEYHSKTKVYPMFYTSESWWESCTGNSKEFVNTNALVLAHYSSSVGTIPGGWPHQTIWQNADSYKYGGDSDIFNGSLEELQKLADG